MQLIDAGSIDGQTLDLLPPSTDPSVGTGPALDIPEPVKSSVDATLPGDSAIPSIGTGSDVLPGAVELTPQQRYEALINRGARKSVAVEEDGTSITFPSSMTDAQESVTKTFSNAQESVTKGITDIQQAANDSFGSAGQAVRGVINNINGSIRGVYDSINGSIKGSVNSVTGLYDKTLDNVQSSVDGTVSKAGLEVVDLTSIFRTGTPLNNQLKEVVIVVKGATGSALEAAGNVFLNFYGSIKVNNLSPEVQAYLNTAEQKVQEVSGPLGSFFQQVSGSTSKPILKKMIRNAYYKQENLEKKLAPGRKLVPMCTSVP